MEKKREKPVETAKEVRGVPFQKGDDPRRNLKVRPNGSLDFKTKFQIFLDKLAKQNNITPEEVDQQLFAVAYKKAKEGEYQFWKDIHDRIYGKALQPVEGEIKGELKITFDKSFDNDSAQ